MGRGDHTPSREARRPSGRSLALAVFAVAAFLMLLGQWQPLLFTAAVPEPWILVLSEAASGRYPGANLVFTSGPLADAYTRLFNPDTFGRVLAVIYGVLAVQAILLVSLARRSRSLLFPLLVLVGLFFVALRDIHVMITPLLAALLGLGRPGSRGDALLSGAGAIASGVSTLIKFAIFPLAVLLFLLVDLNRLRRRRLPFALILYVAATYVSFTLLAPAGGDFVGFLTGSLETSAGYTQAMSIAGPAVELAVYAAMAATALVALAGVERRRLLDGAFGLSEAAQVLAALVFAWLTFKIGFVRHDLHVLNAFAGLSLVVCFYGIARVAPGPVGPVVGFFAAMVVILAGTCSHVLLDRTPSLGQPLATTLGERIMAVPTEFRRMVCVVADPDRWLAERRSEREAETKALAARSPVAALDGTVDSLASIQSSLIAAGLAYMPRPTIQEYTTYTSRVIQANRAFFAREAGPRYVLFYPETIDGRYPASAEGASWPVFLAHFAPQRMAGESLLLRRREAPLRDLLTSETSGIGRMGEPLAIPFGADPVFVSIDVRPTLLGRLADFVFKPPFLYFGVTVAGEPERVFRFVPAIAREGFIASPLIRTARDYLLLAEGAAAEAVGRVVAMRVFAGVGGSLAYRPEIPFTVRRVDRQVLAAGRDWSLTAEQIAAFARDRAFERYIVAAGNPDPGFRVIGPGLFAHAPRRFPVDVARAHGLSIGFGMMPGSEAQVEANGVCFRVLDGEDRTPLWERCLDPVREVADRALQTATVDLAEGTKRVLLETDCRGDCRWDWSYWSEIEPVR